MHNEAPKFGAVIAAILAVIGPRVASLNNPDAQNLAADT
jgi:hypothetical protein